MRQRTQEAPASAETVACPACQRRNRVPAAAAGVPRCAACGQALPWRTTATDGDVADVVDGSSLPVLLDLWAPWCAPCRIVAQGVERAAVEYAGRLKVVAVNVDEAPGVADRFQAQSIPLLLLLDHGHVLARQLGAVNPETLLRWVGSALDAAATGSADGRPGAAGE